ncbi:LuxR C-terminal-related transcriptional regulator [Streptomyces sp. NPDC059828]|uniref:LuxR C-terminal-related transcriptional regulator n=1 Tax=Streptomyces sp. NPDC059828 TaxID=3346965 RepID=UPI00365DC160
MSTQTLPRQWPLVGRTGQIADFERSLADPECSGFVIFGPPGVGKSRLAQECLALAKAAGHIGRGAVATAVAGEVPLGAIAHLVPDGVDLSDPVSGFAATTRLLACMRGEGPSGSRFVVLVDDLHLLDATSAMLLRQLMDARVVFLLATVPSGAPARDAVDALAHGDAVHPVELTEFGSDDIEALLQSVLGGTVQRSTLHTLYDTSGGNALYLRELVQDSLAAGRLVRKGELWTMPPCDGIPVGSRLTDLVRRRLGGPTGPGHRMLETLALCEPLSPESLTADGEGDTLDALERAGLVAVTSEGRRTRIRLAHPLYGEVLRAGMPTLRRREILLRQARNLERAGARRREDAVHLASYRLAATGTADPGLLVQAAALAVHAGDHPRALLLLQAVPAHRRTWQAELLRGKTLFETGRAADADAALARADALARDEQAALAVALVRTQNLIWGTGSDIGRALAANDAARDRVTSPHGLRMLAANEACVRFSGFDLHGSIALLDDVETDGTTVPDLPRWLLAATTKSVVLSLLGQGPQALEWAERALTVCEQTSREEYTLATDTSAVQALRVLSLIECGRLAQARALGELVHEQLGGAQGHFSTVLLSLYTGRAALFAGRLTSARRWFAEVLRAPHTYAAVSRSLAAAGMAAAAAMQGDAESARAALEEYESIPRRVDVPEERIAEAWVHAADGSLSQARAVLTTAVGDAARRGLDGNEAVLLTELARLGGAREAAARLAELAAAGDRPFVGLRSRFATALAAEDPAALMDSAAELADHEADLYAAEAAATAATLWQSSGHPRRAAAARAAAAHRAQRCEGARTPALLAAGAGAQLTRRELEIALLASRNLASRDIAARLTLSTRTVDNHLQRVYAKLGITDRRDLAALLESPGRSRA